MGTMLELVEQSLRLLDFPNDLTALDIFHGEETLRLLLFLVSSLHMTWACSCRY